MAVPGSTLTTIGLPVGRLPQRPVYGHFPGAKQGVPGNYAGPAVGNNPSLVTKDSPPQLPKGPRVRGFAQESTFRGGAYFANDTRVVRDRHGFFKSGYERTGRRSGQTDPPMDGPARPSFSTVNRTINPQQGSDSTRNLDDLTRDYPRTSDGRHFLGEQGSGWSPVYGGVPGLYQPYGSYAGVTSGKVKGIQSPVPQGSPMDGPRKIWGGPPHGYHTQTFPSYSQVLKRALGIPGMRPGRIDRPVNSPIAGQSYSQLVVPQGASAPRPTATRVTSPGRLPQRPARGTR